MRKTVKKTEKLAAKYSQLGFSYIGNNVYEGPEKQAADIKQCSLYDSDARFLYTVSGNSNINRDQRNAILERNIK